MRVDEIMTRRPLTVGPDRPREEVQELLADARIHHMPIVDDGRLVGLWIGHDDGTVAMLGSDEVTILDPKEDAAEAVRAILEGQAAVLALEDGSPAGLITSDDVRRLALAALTHGLHARAHAPVVVRFVGPPGSGKTTLLLRTIGLLQECSIGMVRPSRQAGDPEISADAPVYEDPSADRMSGLMRGIAALGPVRVVFLEDRPGVERPRWGLGESVLVVVSEPDDVSSLSADLISECAALVITLRDGAGSADDAVEQARALRPGMPVFAVDAEGDAARLGEWTRWLRARVLPEAVRRA